MTHTPPELRISPEARRLHDESVVVDLHAHPSVKTYFFNRKLGRRNRSGRALDPLAMRVDLPRLKEGGVNVLLSAIYLPERALADDCFIFGAARIVGPKRYRRLFTGSPFEHTVKLIQGFESVVARTGDVMGVRLEVARSRQELTDITRRGNIALVHTVEGGHSLDHDAGNIEGLFDLGVCMLTLAHFYFNGLAWPVDGVPPGMKPPFCFRAEKNLQGGLEALGRDVVEEMVRLGMIIDLTHCTPPARRDVLAQVNNRHPVVISHVGVAALKPHPMNPTDREIKAIADTGGVIGVIAMNPWLSDRDVANGIDLIVETMKHIRRVGGIEAIAFGSDFDGLTDPPDDLSDHSMMPRLTDALLRSGFSAAEADKIIGANARRVLAEGWGR